MNDQKEFIQLLASAAEIKTREELEQGLQNAGEEGIKKLVSAVGKIKSATTEMEQSNAVKEVKTLWDSYTGKTKPEAKLEAKFGAKLNYIQALRNKCPEGTELYKAGGRVECKKCGGSAMKPTGKKRFDEGGEMPKELIPYVQNYKGKLGNIDVIVDSYIPTKGIGSETVGRVIYPATNDTTYFTKGTKPLDNSTVLIGNDVDQNNARRMFRQVRNKNKK